MKTLEEIRKTESAKLQEELKVLTKQLFEKKFELRNGQAKDSHSIKNLKTEIARIKTVLKEMELIQTIETNNK